MPFEIQGGVVVGRGGFVEDDPGGRQKRKTIFRAQCFQVRRQVALPERSDRQAASHGGDNSGYAGADIDDAVGSALFLQGFYSPSSENTAVVVDGNGQGVLFISQVNRFIKIQGGIKMAQQEKQLNEINALWATYEKCMPDVARAYNELPNAVYADGALSAKMKRLMAVVGALVHGCRACILYQTDEALAAGATAAEILEACAVAISLGGTMGAGETTRIVQFLDEKGLLEDLKKIND